MLYYRNVLAMVEREYDPAVMTYAAFWRSRVFPVYPMSYQTFLHIVNLSRKGMGDLRPTTPRLNRK